jgi:predicted ATPase
LRDAFAAKGGVEVDTQGDAFFYAFPTAPGALEAAAAATEQLDSGPIRVRIGLHTGTPHVAEEGYVGTDVHRAARIAAAGHGGQVLISAATASLVESSNSLLLDLGEHRLKDLSAPERIYQLGEGEFPPLKTLYRTNLPISATPFLGREHELAELQELLGREDVRLLTLTGPGGTGKTRLGLQAAAEASEDYPDGLFWVSLAPLRDPELVLDSAAQALGAKDGLAEHVADKRLLLLFDNFEHVVDAAVGLSELLAACPNLRLLVTSRELLRVPGEQAYPVPPLEPEDGTDLFVARARAAKPDFEPDEHVPELCARLEQLPLALELAAARVRVLQPEQLLERLSGRLDLLKAGRGVDPRQQTLRATIEWSHELLNEDEQGLFARLAVFVGGCTLEAAEQVCDAELDTLQSLVDKSLVRVREDERFWMLETIREFALERLEASGEAEELRRRHAEYLLALAEEAEPYLWPTQSKEWLDLLERENDNLRAAFDEFERAGETQTVLKFAGSLVAFWGVRGFNGEGRRRVEAALRADERPTAARAKALNAAADMAMGQGDDAAVKLRAEQALALHRSLGDDRGAAEALFLLGNAAAEERDFPRARDAAEESARLYRKVENEHGTMYATWLLAWAYSGLGETDRGNALTEEVLERARAVGSTDMQAMVLSGGRATRAIEEGRVGAAVSMLEEAYHINRVIGNRWRLTHIASRLAHALASLGAAAAATRLLSSGRALFEEIGGNPPSHLAREDEVTLALVRDKLSETEFAEAWEQGRKLTPEEAIELALAEPDSDA